MPNLEAKLDCMVQLFVNSYGLDRLLDDAEYAKSFNILDCHREYWFRYFVPSIKKYGLDVVNEVVKMIYDAHEEAKRHEEEDDG